MPRDTVYQLRLTHQEKARLKKLAGEESISQMIRKTFGLTPAEPEEPETPEMDAAAGDAAALSGPGSDRDEAIEALTQQFHNQGYTWPIARRMAREELTN